MFKALFTNMRDQASNDKIETKRQHPRRVNDRCVIEICGQTFPIVNWSYGGVLISVDDRLFGLDQDIDFTLKFKLRSAIIGINHRGHIVRKQNSKVAVQFEPLTQTISRNFQKVVDDSAALEFANSQT